MSARRLSLTVLTRVRSWAPGPIRKHTRQNSVRLRHRLRRRLSFASTAKGAWHSIAASMWHSARLNAPPSLAGSRPTHNRETLGGRTDTYTMTEYRSSAIGVVGMGMSTDHNQPNFFDDILNGILQGGNRFDRDI